MTDLIEVDKKKQVALVDKQPIYPNIKWISFKILPLNESYHNTMMTS